MAGSKQPILHLAAGLFPVPSTSAASCPDRGSRRKHRRTHRGSSAVYSGSLRLENRPCHGTDHHSKPLSSPSGIRLPTRSLRPRQEKHRSGRATAGGLGGGLLGVPPASSGLRSSSRALLRVHSVVGLSGFPAVPHAARRLNCGVVVEEVPWGDGKHQLTRAYMLFLARWARKLSWKETAEAFHTSWDQVCDAVDGNRTADSRNHCDTRRLAKCAIVSVPTHKAILPCACLRSLTTRAGCRAPCTYKRALSPCTSIFSLVHSPGTTSA